MSDAEYRARIAPMAPGSDRPLWSVMIPAYHCARFLEETLSSVLVQEAGPEQMQIEVVDDHSTADDPESVVKKIGRGRVGFYRQGTNVGVVRNFATCLQRARGQLVHLLHGDDSVMPRFYQKMQAAFTAGPEIGAAFCRQIFVDSAGRQRGMSPLELPVSGVLDNGLEHLARQQRIMTPSMVVRRSVYEALGGFDERLICAEDWEMWVRIAAHYAVWYEVEPLARYRMHDHSNTGRHTVSGNDMRYTGLAIDLFGRYLPPDRAHEITAAARQTYALSALGTMTMLLERGEWRGSGAQLREALRLDPSLKVLAKAATVTGRALAAKLLGRSSS